MPHFLYIKMTESSRSRWSQIVVIRRCTHFLYDKLAESSRSRMFSYIFADPIGAGGEGRRRRTAPAYDVEIVSRVRQSAEQCSFFE